MLLGYNTNGLQSHRLDDGLRLLADRGFQAVALTLDVQHLDPFRSGPREVDAIAALLETLALHPVIETGARFLLDPGAKHEPTLMTPDAEGRARRIDFYRRAAAVGADLGAGVVSFWAGVDRAPGPDSPERLREGVTRACAAIRTAGLEPAFEPEPGMAVETVAAYEALCTGLNGVSPALCLDIGHLLVTGEGDPCAIIRNQVGRIAQVHLEDVRSGVHEHLVPGEGDVNFVAVLEALQDGGYEGPVCFELSRSSHMAPQAMELCLGVWRAVAR